MQKTHRNNIEDDISMSDSSSVTMLTLDNLSVVSKGKNNNSNLSSNYSSNLKNVPNLLSNYLSPEDQKLKDEMNEALNRKKLARSIPIPANDEDVKKKLREMGQPICLFGENAVDRRERLKKEVLEIVMKEGKIPEAFIKTKTYEKVEENEVFYTEGSIELKEARMEIAKFSIPRSAYRIELSKKKFMNLDRIGEGLQYEEFLNTNKNFEFTSSQYADERGCSRGSLSPDDKYYAVAGWSGVCTILAVPDLNKVTYLKGHSERVNSIVFHPKFGEFDFPGKGPNLATGSCDNLIKIWSFLPERENQLCINLTGHEDRVNGIAFHPLGDYLASTSHDKTWRLWDIDRKKELLLQEGHSEAVYCLSFQNDGALLATGDLAGIGLVWDLRSGKNIMTLQGHVKQMLSIKFFPNSYQIATGSDDNTIKIWDLRRKMCTHTIPAHNSMVSDVSFENSDGKFLISSSLSDNFW